MRGDVTFSAPHDICALVLLLLCLDVGGKIGQSLGRPPSPPCRGRRKRLAASAHDPGAAEAALRALGPSQLAALAAGPGGACMRLPEGPTRLATLFRWADLRGLHELRPHCRAAHPCGNPYHWSRVYKPDSPPPPYSKHQELQYEEESSEAVSYSIFSSHLSDVSDSSPWCRLAYWELSSRVGRLLPVSQQKIDVFYDVPHGDGLCLRTLATSRPTDVPSVLHTRNKIGRGITLSREDNTVFVHNRSECPVFVNSPTLDPPGSQKLTVHRIPPGYCVNLFDFDVARLSRRSVETVDGPFNPNAVRISFAKGWGTKYSRRCVMSCPCWLEVMFNR